MIRLTLAMFVVCGCMCVCVRGAQGQSRPAESPQQSAARQAEEAVRARTAAAGQTSAMTLNINFPGGTVEEYVALIRETLAERREPVNIMVKDGARHVVLPAMELVDVSLDSALSLLHQHVGEDPAGRVVQLDLDMLRGDGAPVFVIAPRHAVSGPRVAQQQSQSRTDEVVHVWNVSEMQAFDMKADDMLTAIETALSLVRSTEEKAEIRFHEATGLIIARGTREQISTMDQVIEQLERSAQGSAGARERARKAKQGAEALVALEARVQEMNALRQEMEVIKREREALLHEVRALQDRHEISVREHQARTAGEQAESARRIAELEYTVRQLQQELAKTKGDGE